MIHNNDPAMGNLDYLRRDEDFYPTPEWMTLNIVPILQQLSLLPTIQSGQIIWEPACGDGAISKVLIDQLPEYQVVSTDLVDYGFGTQADFFTTKFYSNTGLIITNPPYGDNAEEFVRHALELMRPIQGKVVMLLRNEWDSSKRRMDLFNSCAAYRAKIVATTRPRWIEGTKGSPRHNYSWFCWDWNNPRPLEPVIRYFNKDPSKK